MFVNVSLHRSATRRSEAGKHVSRPRVQAHGVPAGSTRRRTRLTLLGLLLGLLLSMLDNFIVATAMPTILRDLGDVGLVSWVVTAYTLTSAVSTPVWGKLSDLRGRKLMFQLAVGVFLAGSVLAALAPSMAVLVAARAFQGLGAGGLAVGAFAIIADLVPARERGSYQGMVTLVIAVGTIGGPLIGGFVTSAFGWRWAFLINVPLGVVTLLWIGLLLKLPTHRRRARIDWVGAALLGGLVSAVVLLASGSAAVSANAFVRDLGLGLIALVCLVCFVRQERRTLEPILPLRIFVNRNFTMAVALACCTSAVSFACMLYVPQFQQSAQQVDAGTSGLLMLPMLVPVVVSSLVAGRAMASTGRFKALPVAGAVCLTVGGGLLATMTSATPAVATSAFLVFVGTGLGLTQMTTTIAQNSVDRGDLGAASSVVTLVRTLGGTVAVAVFGGVFASRTSGLTGTAMETGVARATSLIFLVVTGIAVVGVVAAVAIRPTTLPNPDPDPSAITSALDPVVVAPVVQQDPGAGSEPGPEHSEAPR